MVILSVSSNAKTDEEESRNAVKISSFFISHPFKVIYQKNIILNMKCQSFYCYNLRENVREKQKGNPVWVSFFVVK